MSKKTSLERLEEIAVNFLKRWKIAADKANRQAVREGQLGSCEWVEVVQMGRRFHCLRCSVVMRDYVRKQGANHNFYPNYCLLCPSCGFGCYGEDEQGAIDAYELSAEDKRRQRLRLPRHGAKLHRGKKGESFSYDD